MVDVDLAVTLDVQLLLRKKQPELTEAGKRVYRFTQMVMNEEQAALEDVEQIRSGAMAGAVAVIS